MSILTYPALYLHTFAWYFQVNLLFTLLLLDNIPLNIYKQIFK